MRAIAGLVLGLLAALLSGCGSYYHFIDAAVDPSVRPKRSDPIFVTLASSPTIRDRQLVVVLKEELCRGGFKVVDKLDQSTWVLGLMAARSTFETGSSTTATAVPLAKGTSFAVASTERNFQRNQFARLMLFKSVDFADQKRLPMWEGQVGADNDTFIDFEPTIFKGVLDVFGSNFSERSKIDRQYNRQVTRCDPAQPSQPEICRCSTRGPL